MAATQMLDALVIGNSILDLVWSLEAPIVIDGKVTARGLTRFAGGQAANAAYTLGRLGLSVEFVGSFGDDSAGDFCKQALRDANVKLTAAQTRRGCGSQTAAVLVDVAAGTRTIAMYRPSSLALLLDAAIIDLARRSRLIYVDGYEPEVQLVALQTAGGNGRIRLSDIEVVSEATRALVDETDHLIVPRAVALELSGERDAMAAVRVLGTSRTAIATDGARPFFFARDGTVSARDTTLFQTADTTGVGDAFRAGYAAALLAGFPLDECVATALATAGEKLRSAGPRIDGEEAFAALRARLGQRIT
jgi:sulfofructose kinase